MEEEEIKDNNGENLNIQVNYYDENIELSINSDYETFIQKICDFLKINPDEFNSYSLSYHDQDGDSIILSTIEDYKLFIQQVKENIVNKLIIEKKENIENNDNEMNYSENDNLILQSVQSNDDELSLQMPQTQIINE